MPGGVCIPAFLWAEHPPPHSWTEFLTHACEDITFPQLLLRAVNIVFFVDKKHREKLRAQGKHRDFCLDGSVETLKRGPSRIFKVI